MGKSKITKEELHRIFENVVVVRNQSVINKLELLSRPAYYNCGTYGWNFDVYQIGRGKAVIDGYRCGKEKMLPLSSEKKAEKRIDSVKTERGLLNAIEEIYFDKAIYE